MSAKEARRRGACPSLFAPMPTGDGLLVRLPRPERGLSPGVLAALSRLAARTGNGAIDITARGNIQLRGLSAATLADLRAGLEALGLLPEPGVAVETNALLGIDPTLADGTAAVIAAVQAGLAAITAPLAPKLAIVVDGGGLLPMDGLAADIRLRTVPGGWQLAVADRVCGAGTAEAMTAAAVDRVRAIAALGPFARARDLPATAPSGEPVPAGPVEPVGTLADGLVGLGLPFGRIDAPVLARLADAARQAGADSLRPAPGRALIVTGLRRAATAGLIDRAAALGLVTTPDDPRRRIIACVGAPGCASALVSTRDIAALVAERLAEAGDIVHVSGCAKGCAHPRPAALTLVGTPSGVALIRNGRADAVPERLIAPAEVGPLIASRCSKASHDL